MLKVQAGDTEKVRAWLAIALDAGSKRGLSASGLAKHCGATPQAVSGWKRTGRITKTNLAKAVEYFGHDGPSFSGVGPVAREDRRGYGAWPFAGIEQSRFDALTADEKTEIQGVVRDRIERFEAARAASQKPAPHKKRKLA